MQLRNPARKKVRTHLFNTRIVLTIDNMVLLLMLLNVETLIKVFIV